MNNYTFAFAYRNLIFNSHFNEKSFTTFGFGNSLSYVSCHGIGDRSVAKVSTTGYYCRTGY